MLHSSNKKPYFYLGSILLLIIVFHYAGWLVSTENFFRSLLIPSFTQIHTLSVRVGDNYQFFKNRQDFFTSYAQCSATAQNQQIREARLKILEDENNELRKQLGFRRELTINSVTAEVVGNNIEGEEKTITINAGSALGIKINQPVVAGSGVMIGKIVKVEENISVVRLINDSRSKVAGTVLNSERSPGVVEGGYGLSLRMNFIPRDETVLVGNEIVTSGLEPNIPRGLLLGTVAVVENEAYQPFQQTVLTPAINLSKLIWVSILLTG